MEYLNETLQICFTSKVTYCDKEPSLLPFQFMSYLPLIGLKNGFWPVVHLLYGISEWNFTDMLIIKGYILWLRIVTLTFPDCELSSFDWSENWFVACSFFYFMEYLNGTSQICWTSKVTYFFVRTVTLTFPVHELSALDWSEKWFLTCSSFTIWSIWMKLHRYVDHQRLHIVGKDRHSYLSRLWVIHPWLIWELVFDL